MISDDFLYEVASKNDIVDLVSSHTSLKKTGRSFVGLCPFHNEKTPSFHVYPDNQSFYCFGCSVGGDVITFVKLAEGLEFIDAVKYLAERVGMQVPENDQDFSISKKRNRIYEANRAAARFYHHTLYTDEGKMGLAYLRHRGLSEYTIKHFGLGFSPTSYVELTNFLMQKGFTQQELMDANLSFISRKGNLVDRFVGRVMFPIIDIRGNVIAFGGRIMSDEKPKYLNTSDTPVFKKSNNLFALNFAKRKTEDRLILAEGYMDVIALHQAGFIETVATLGTSLTVEQARIMKSYTKEVVIAYDSDLAGRKATSRAMNILRDAGLLVKVLNLPNGKDPDEFLKSHRADGPVRFKQVLEKCNTDVEYQLQKVEDEIDLKSSEGKVAYLKEAVKILASINDAIEREVYAGQVSEKIDVQKSIIVSQIGARRKAFARSDLKREFKKVQENISGLHDKVNTQKNSHLRASCAEEALISYVMHNQDLAEKIITKISPDKFVTDFNKKVYEHIINRLQNNKSINIIDFGRDFSEAETSKIMKMFLSYDTNSGDISLVQDYIDVILQEHEKDSLSENSSEDQILSYLESLKNKKK